MSRDEWEYCFYLYVERRKSQTVRKSSTPFWLRDILHCNECQLPFKTKNQKRKVNVKMAKKWSMERFYTNVEIVV